MAGPTNPVQAKQQAPESWRARFGSEGAKNAVHVGANEEQVERDISFFFSE